MASLAAALVRRRSINPPRLVGETNTVLAGLMLHVVRYPIEDLPRASSNQGANNLCQTSKFAAKLAGVCLGDDEYSELSDLGGYGVDPVWNAESALYEGTSLNISDW